MDSILLRLDACEAAGTLDATDTKDCGYSRSRSRVASPVYAHIYLPRGAGVALILYSFVWWGMQWGIVSQNSYVVIAAFHYIRKAGVGGQEGNADDGGQGDVAGVIRCDIERAGDFQGLVHQV